MRSITVDEWWPPPEEAAVERVMREYAARPVGVGR